MRKFNSIFVTLNLVNLLSLIVADSKTTASLKERNTNSQSSRVISETGSIIANRAIDAQAPDNVYQWFARPTKNGFTDWIGCGAQLVSQKFVLTAAHCVSKTNLGSKDTDGIVIGARCAPFEPGDNCDHIVEQFEIQKVFVHPQWNPSTFDNNLALLQIDGESQIAPVGMNEEDIAFGNGYKFKTVGFGIPNTPGFNGDAVSNRLMETTLNSKNNVVCKGLWGDSQIKDSNICASMVSSYSCYGDDGGPLFDEAMNKLVGVRSFGAGCDMITMPGVYTSTSAHFEWLKKVICENQTVKRPKFCYSDSSTPYPTPTPLQCPSEQTLVGVRIILDDYPDETSWFIKNYDQAKILLGSPLYNVRGVTHFSSICLPLAAHCYFLKIMDNYGDGIEGGSYTLELDNEIYETGSDDFAFNKIIKFGNTCSKCNEGKEELRLDILTDGQGQDITWRLERYWGSTFSNPANLVVDGGVETPYTSNSLIEESHCIPSTGCYQFTIYDKNQNGLSDGGYFKIDYQDMCLIKASSFDAEKKIIFGDCPFDHPTIDTCESIGSNSTASPTTSPVLCSDDRSWVEVSITTDEYPYETSWDIQLYEQWYIPLKSPTYQLQNYKYHDAKCLNVHTNCYWFHVMDYIGDGFGEGGSYTLKVDGIVRFSGEGDFGGETTKTFKFGDVCPVCDNKQDEIKLELITDDAGEDISWTLEKWQGNAFVDYLSGGDDEPYPSNTNTTISHCVPPNSCYRLTMKDKGKNGFCCDEGEGYFRLSFKESCILQASKFGEEKVIIIGDSCPFDRPTIDTCESIDSNYTASPTISPGVCSDGKSWVEVSITTDEYPYETSWDIQLYEQWYIPVKSPTYQLQYHNYHEETCLSLKDTCYWFHVMDYIGDGFGEGGNYTLKVDGIVRFYGEGDFGGETTKTFKFGDVCPVCDNKQDEIKLELITDDAGEDISWTLEKWQGNAFVDYLSGGDDEPYPSNTNTTISHCVPPNSCYRLTMKDKGKNGFCCDEGEGYFRLSFKESCILQASKFGEEKVIIIGDSCPFDRPTIDTCYDDTVTEVTLSPTLAPKSCSDGKSWVEVSITTDEYPYETSWDIQLYEKWYMPLQSPAHQLQKYTSYHDAKCLSVHTNCYWFHVMDYIGDGFGEGGSYTLKVDGIVRFYGEGDFGGETTKTFKFGDVCPVCDNKQDEIKLELITDDAGEDISWTIEKWQGNAFVDYLSGGDDEPYPSNTNTTISHCVPPNSCYRLTMKDKGKNGFCCDEGEGYFRLSFKESCILQASKFGEEKVIIIGDSCPFDHPTIDTCDYNTENKLTPSPTLAPKSCTDGKSWVEVSITTDEYPYETSWDIVTDGGYVADSSSYSPQFNLQYHTYHDGRCLATDQFCYNFILKDYAGDGLSGGNYALKIDGILHSSGSLGVGYQRIVRFGLNCGSCSNNQDELQLDILTDDMGSEITWSLKEITPQGYNYFSNIFLEGGIEKPYWSNTKSVEYICLPRNSCFQFFMFDDGNDGLCCQNGDGEYSLSYKGATIQTGKSFGGKDVSVRFGNGCDKCTSGFSPVSLTLLTDDAPAETYWETKQSTGIFFNTILEGGKDGSYLSKKQYVFDNCIRSDGCYKFFIYDKGRDGLCCGKGKGGYELMYEGNMVQSSLNNPFTGDKLISKTFGSGCDKTCGTGTSLFTVAILTDNKGAETKWNLKIMDNGIFEVMYKGGYSEAYENNILYTSSYCIPTDACYRFTIFDDGNDGLCCGQGNGYYAISLDGSALRQSQFIGGSSETKLFGACKKK